MRRLLTLALLSIAAAAPAAEPEALRESSPTARQAMEGFGICVADRSPEKAAQTLQLDFRTKTYQSALRNLARANEDCFRRRNDAMRSNNLSFAGSIAERLIERDPAPVNARIVRASTISIEPRTPSDAIAICAVRSAPDDVARLFATDVASEAEAQAVNSLQLATKLCSKGQGELETTVEGLRAMLATAAFRAIHSTDPVAGGEAAQ